MLSLRAWRCAVAAGALVVGAGIVQAGVAERLARSDPLLAARVAPHDARIAMAAARKLVEGGKGASDRAIRALTQATLTRDLTQTAAIEFRAVDAEAVGDRGRGQKLFDLSAAISRRSLPTRLWLIQRSVDRGDVGGALRDFDVALRTSTAAAPVLFPVLAGATTDPGLVAPIARMLDRPSDWRVMFLNYAVAQGDMEGVVAVLLRLDDHALVTGNGIDRALIARLVDERRFALAGRVRDAFAPARGARALVADGGFADSSAVYPFGWALNGRGDAGAERSATNGRPVLAYRAAPGRGGQVAAQLLLLGPGTYRLTATAGSTATPGAIPYWSLTCGEKGGASLAQLDMPARDGASGSVDFTILPGCAGQWLTLMLAPGEAADGQSGAVRSVMVRPVARAVAGR